MKFAARTINAQRYGQVFRAFVTRTTEYSAILRRLEQASATLPPSFSCLDVGAGTGSLLRDWFSSRITSPNTNHPGRYVAIEPNPDLAVELQQNIDEIGISGTVIEDHLHPEFVFPSKDNSGNDDNSQKCDMILFSHSLYYMPDPVGCIRHAMQQWLKPGSSSMALIFHNGPFGFNNIYRLYNADLERDVQGIANHGLSSHDLVHGLSSQWQPGGPKLVTTVHIDEASLNLTDLFDDSNPQSEKERDDFLSFLLQAEFSELFEPIKSEIVQHLRGACSTDAEGTLTLHHPNVTIEVRSP